jgi:hypothetical protein
MTIKISKPSIASSKSINDLFEQIEKWISLRREFDTSILAERGCWPITEKHYKKFTINKRNGSKRDLVTVNSKLKGLQSNLKNHFEKVYSVSKYAYAFVPKDPSNASTSEGKEAFQKDALRPKGVVSNALAHTNKKVVISIDLKDFFPTISFPRVMGMLKTSPYNYSNRQAAVLASLVCLPKNIDEKRGLPQGAPTSPLFSNLICNKLDYQLGNLAGKYDLTYTRYADDLTFSTNNIKRISPQELVERVTQHVERNGFKVNESKTKIMFKEQRQMVTGILVNDGLNLNKKHVDALRATLYNLEYKYNSVKEAAKAFWKLSDRQAFDAFLPVGFYNGGRIGRFVKANQKGIKGAKRATDKEFEDIYLQHLYGRILWYGQVVTTTISSPYALTKRQFISPKQHSRIQKYEEMLASFYRISMKFRWPVDHIILKQANKLPHLQSLVKMDPSLQLENFPIDEEEQKLKDAVYQLRSEKVEYTEFFNNAPKSLRRALLVQNRSHSSFKLDTFKQCVDFGWPDPVKQQEVFAELNSGILADLFHKSTSGDGHNVKELILETVKIIRPRLRYLSSNISKKITRVHRELLNLIRNEGDDVRIDIEKETKQTELAIQAIRDLKAEVRLHEDDTGNFYQKIIQPALKNSGMESLIIIDKNGMAPRLITDIQAWCKALTGLLISVKDNLDKSELRVESSEEMPLTLIFRDKNPVTKVPRAIELYRKNTTLPFKKRLNIDEPTENGLLKKWLLGGDLTGAVKEFLPVGDLFVHGSYEDIEDVTVNLTAHSHQKEQSVIHKEYGCLIFSLEELVK